MEVAALNDPSATPAPPAPELSYPDAASLPAKVTVIATIQSLVMDLSDLAAQPNPGEPEARVADRLAEEASEVGAMIRALPGRPASMSGHDTQMLAALRTAHASGEDVAETIARALARLAAELGGSEQVLRNRPGSWEAAVAEQLLVGTVGPDGEGLDMYQGPGGPGGSL
jgi:hypothetical protein